MKTQYTPSSTSKKTYIRFLFVLMSLLPFASKAVSYTWIGGVSTEWGNASNWSPSTGTPDFGDDVTIQSGTFSPVFEEIAGLNNFTINSGSLNLAGFTLSISGSSNFNGGNISNGTLSCSGTTIFSGSSISATVSVSSTSISFNGSNFSQPVSVTKTGAGSVTSTGGNTFDGTFTLNNSGAGEVILCSLNPDTYKANVTFTNSGSGWISASHAAAGTSYLGDIVFNSTASSPGIRLGQGGGTSSLANTKTLQIGGSGFSVGDLFIKNLTQIGTTAQSLTLTGTASLSIETGCIFNGNVSFTSPHLFLDGATYEGDAEFVKNSSGNNQSIGGNTFNGVATFTNSGSGELILGVSNPDDFNDVATFNQTGSQTIFVAHGASGTTFAENIVVNSTGSARGIRFGQAGGTSTLASGKTIEIGVSGFTAGSLRLRNFTQSGSTAQNISLTSGTAALYLESGSTFNGAVNFNVPQLYLSGTTFNAAAVLEKNGATSNTGTGGNTFATTASISNSGSGLLILGSTIADVFNGSLTLSSSGSSAIQLAQGGNGHQFNENIIVNSTGSSLGIRIGQAGGTSVLAASKTITIGLGGFSSGDLTLRAFTQTGSTSQSLTSFSGSSFLQLEGGTVFNGAVTFSAPGINLNGATFNSTAVLTKNGAISSNSTGGNTFNSTVTLSSSGSGEWILGSSNPDIFEGNLTIENAGSELIYLAEGSTANVFNGNIELNSTGSSAGIRLGQNGGTSTLASGKTISIGSAGFTSGDLRLAGFTQAGTTAQSLTTFGSGTELYLETGTTFNASSTFICPGVYLNGATFNNTAIITKNGTGPNLSTGGNVFNGVTTISVTGSGALYLGSSSADDFNEDVSFRQTTAFTLYPAYNSSSTFSKSISTTGSSTTVNFSAGGGRVVLDGTVNQNITGDVSTPPDFFNLTVNKSANRVTLQTPVTVSNQLTLTSGRINTTSTNLLTILDNATVSGVSNSSYVSGPCRKEGNDAFTFPIGAGGFYRSIGISAPATTGSQFTARFLFDDSDATYAHSSKDGSLDHLSHCEYWILDRDAGSSSVSVTLSWNTTSCGVTNLSDLRVARWNGSMWKDHGNGGTSGNTVAGSLVSSGSISSFSPFTLSSSSSENPLPVNLVHFAATPKDDQVQIEWTTVSETNNDYFTVEVSQDAVEFKEVNKVSGAGNSNSILNYVSYDNAPHAGISYYRLKQVDFDGKVMYSGIRVVEMVNLWQNEIIVSPNPVASTATLRLDPDQFSNPVIEIRDLQGRLIRSIGMIEVNPAIPMEVDLKDIPSGLYFVQAIENGKTAIRRIVKK